MNESVDSVFDAWNPGLDSRIPQRLQPLITLFRETNATMSYPDAKELADLTGLKLMDLVSLRPERLIVHELLVRVTADLSVADGPNYADLGISLRNMVEKIYSEHVKPELPQLCQSFNDQRILATQFIDQQLSRHFFPLSGDETHPGGTHTEPQGVTRTGFAASWSSMRKTLQSILPNSTSRILRSGGPGSGGPSSGSPSSGSPSSGDHSTEYTGGINWESAGLDALASWKSQREVLDDPLLRCCTENLILIVGAMLGHRGRLVIDQSLITRIVANRVSNEQGARLLGQLLEPIVVHAALKEKYRVLPVQNKPVIMNVKGASAAGKSTIRPQQRQLAEKLGIPWEDFAVISPDYWRKHLLKYESLGDDAKYGAMLTGQELEIIDKKLDRYMTTKAANGEISHLLIDRFRFDSFKTRSGAAADSQLLSRFGDRIFLFFMVTPPEETVLRAWKRGLSTGRYKSVGDLLYHNVEAFEGMPSLFFSWVKSKEKNIHFEFLDNDVPEGQLPRTAAFGWNDTMTILDVQLMVRIDAYRKLDVEARSATQVFENVDTSAAANIGFILRCVDEISEVRFVDPKTGNLIASTHNGKLTWWDNHFLTDTCDNFGLHQALRKLGYTENQWIADTQESSEGMSAENMSAENISPENISRENISPENRGQPDSLKIEIDAERSFTLGSWP